MKLPRIPWLPQRPKEHVKYSLPQNMLWILRGAWESQKIVFLYVALYTLLSALFPFVAIFGPKLLIDELLGPRRPEYLVAVLLGFFALGSAMQFLITFCQARYGFHAIVVRLDHFIGKLFVHLLTMEFKHTEDPVTMDRQRAVWQAINNNQNGIEGVLRNTFEIVGKLIAFAGYGAIVFTLHPLVLLLLVVGVALTYLFTLRAKDYEYDKKDERAGIDRRTGYVYDTMFNFQHGKDVRLYHMAPMLRRRFRALVDEESGLSKDIRKRYWYASIVDGVSLIARECAVYGYLIYRSISQAMPIGDFWMYFSTIAGFSGWMRGIMDSVAHMRAQNKYISDFREFLESGAEPPQDTRRPLPAGDTLDIAFENVSFKYPGTQKWVFQGLNLKIPAGQRLAIVGVNGAGKTSLVKLLARLYDPDEGRVLVGGVDIREYDRAEYLRAISAVFQEVKLFAFPIAENVALEPIEKIDRARVQSALDMAGLTEKIESLPKGLDTVLLKHLDDAGIELSGGENQRVALARALYKGGRIAVLDEPTAALDPLAEYNLYTRFDEMIGGKTALYISHRLASTRFCDIIAFFEEGKILEYGTHDELMAQNGRYAEMFEVQAHYYREEVAS